ncbi:MAG: hypothetical protein P4L51_00740 [Puia sp.]|nr:hypothetical protein [Puia sp.]
MKNENLLDTSNSHCYVYTSDEIKVEVLGGIRIDVFDRLRVTLKISKGEQSIRHNLDLYNDSQLERVIRKAAERLEIGSILAGRVIAGLTDELEKYRLLELEKLQEEGSKRMVLSDEDTKAAVDFLKNPDLLGMTNDLIGTSGVIGEENNRLLMYLIFTSRKRDQPLHVISLGSSGTGKSHLQEKVGELIPPEDKIEITTLSQNAFYYFGRQELRNKLILIEDLDGAGEVLYPLRELQSKQAITKSLPYKNSAGETKTIHLRVEGPVCIAGCTTRESIYEDNANRSFLLYLDESREQDSRIMEYQRKKSAGKINSLEEGKSKLFLQHVQTMLQPISVRNPFAEALQLPATIFKPRRTNAHYLAFIEAITFYHQYQREQKVDEETGEMYIETTKEDIAAANELMKEILLRKSDDLTGACRNYLEQVSQYLAANELDSFSNLLISKVLRMPVSTVKRHNLALLTAGYLIRVNQDKTKSFHYTLVSQEDYRSLKTSISTLLDSILQTIGSPMAQSTNEPMKPKLARKRKPSAQ